jgi:Ca-activated chloride channel family protein
MINYFQYAYPEPEGEHPFSVSVEVAQCPWRPERRLARIGLKAREMDRGQRPPANLVFLLDVSGSMNAPDKLPLVKKAMRMLLHQMSASDRVAIVAYSDSSRVVLPSTSCYARRNILNAFARLQPGGSTNGGAGIELAYREAAENYIPDGINRVVLCTDGDFNVGITGQDELVTLIESKARGGVFLSVMGFGTGNLKDSNLEKLADHGNGHYGYIDSEGEARKVFVDQVGGALATVAKDVKAQVEFNPRKVQAYRLVGYENRVMDADDFNDDTKDAGDIGAGHTVTVLYELIPPGEKLHEPDVDPLKYQAPSEPDREYGDELMTVKLRYKEPEGLRSQMLAHAVQDADTAFAQASDDFRFAAAVAAFGMILRGSPHRGKATLRDVIDWAEGVVTNDSSPYRKEFIELAHTALDLQ